MEERRARGQVCDAGWRVGESCRMDGKERMRGRKTRREMEAGIFGASQLASGFWPVAVICFAVICFALDGTRGRAASSANTAAHCGCLRVRQQRASEQGSKGRARSEMESCKHTPTPTPFRALAFPLSALWRSLSHRHTQIWRSCLVMASAFLGSACRSVFHVDRTAHRRWMPFAHTASYRSSSPDVNNVPAWRQNAGHGGCAAVARVRVAAVARHQTRAAYTRDNDSPISSV